MEIADNGLILPEKGIISAGKTNQRLIPDRVFRISPETVIWAAGNIVPDSLFQVLPGIIPETALFQLMLKASWTPFR
jgi:hypothetical protein